MPEVRAQIILTAKDDASKTIKGVGDSANALSKGFAGAIQNATGLNVASIGLAAGVAALGTAFKWAVGEAAEAQSVMAMTEARIKATGGAAGFTAKQMGEFASQMQNVSTFSDEAVLGAQNMLMTFENIKGDNFKAATAAAMDLAAAMGRDLPSTAFMLGRALEDPARGMMMLRRMGIILTEDQKKVVKQLQATGDAAGAQAYLLDILNKKFGGSAAAQAKTYAGALAQLKNAISDLGESIGGPFLPALTEFAHLLTMMARDAQKAGILSFGFDDIAKAVIRFVRANSEAGKSAIETANAVTAQIAGEKMAYEGAASAMDTYATSAEGLANALQAGLSGNIGKGTQDVRDRLAEIAAEIAKLERGQGRLVTVQKDATATQLDLANAQFDAETATIKLAEAQQKLAENTDPDKMRALQGAVLDASVAVQNATAKIDKMSAGLGSTTTYTVDNTKKIKELTKEQEELAARLKESTAQFLYQQLAVEDDTAANLALARQLGILDEASYQAAIVSDELKQRYLAGQISASEYAVATGNLASAIASLQSRDITITQTTIQRTIVEGAIQEYRAGEKNYIPSPPKKRAGGGDVQAGMPYLIGERGPEMFVPRIGGTVVPNNQLGRGAGVVIQNVTLNNDIDMAKFEGLLRRALR